MKKIILFLLVCAFATTVNATITVYENGPADETAFNTAISGLQKTEYDFDEEPELPIGEVLNERYSPFITFVTKSGFNIIANDNAYNTLPHSGTRCAQVNNDGSESELDFFELQFVQPVSSVSLWILDIYLHVNVTVYDDADGVLQEFPLVRPGSADTFIGVLSDINEIARIRIEASDIRDGLGFDNVVVVPEPATMVLLGLGSLMLHRKKH